MVIDDDYTWNYNRHGVATFSSYPRTRISLNINTYARVGTTMNT